MTKRPDLTKIRLVGRDGQKFEFVGVELASGSSERTTHSHDLSRDRYTPRGVRCSACRWHEITLYRRYVTEGIDLKTDPARPRIYPIEPVPGDYVVHTVGESLIPGETRLSRISLTDSAYEVVELLTVRRPGSEPFMTAQSARVLARAAEFDDDIHDAYVNRAVV